MPKSERYDAKVSSRGCTSARSERFGAELHELRPKRGRSQEGGITSKTHISTTNEHILKKKVSPESERLDAKMSEIRESDLTTLSEYKNPRCDNNVRGELGDRGNKGNGALNPEIFAKRCDTACLPKNRGIFGCTRATATKSIPLERYRRVHPETRFARGTDEQLLRYRVGEVGMTKVHGCLTLGEGKLRE
ncbi:hypothetical protein EDD16DRAFT_1524345 [Pisolithus croceorrhizus]|nr:hypothetical protein EDD16DRAFT_1524345 [Pisolithus croceorrhizus]